MKKYNVKKFAENTQLSRDLADKVLDLLYKKGLDGYKLDCILYRMERKIISEQLQNMMNKMTTADIQAIIDQVAVEYEEDVEQSHKEVIARSFFIFNEDGKEYKAGDIVTVQIMKTGKWNHPEYGEFEITKNMLQEFKENFEKNKRGVKLAVDENHEPDHKALAWFQELYIENNNQLFAKVQLTKKGANLLTEGAYKYFSPEFIFKKVDEESGEVVSNLLLGGAFTNRPFFKAMQPLFANEDMSDKQTDQEQKTDSYILFINEARKVQMNEYMKLVAELSDKKNITKEEKETLEKAFSELSEELKKSEEYTSIHNELITKFSEPEESKEEKTEDSDGEKKEEEKEEQKADEKDSEDEEGKEESKEDEKVEAKESNEMISVKLSEFKNMQSFVEKVNNEKRRVKLSEKLNGVFLSEKNPAGLKVANIDEVINLFMDLSKDKQDRLIKILSEAKYVDTREIGHDKDNNKEYDAKVKAFAIKKFGMSEEDAEKTAKYFSEQDEE